MQADPQTRPPKDGASKTPLIILAVIVVLGVLAWLFWPKAEAPQQQPLPPPVMEQETQPAELPPEPKAVDNQAQTTEPPVVEEEAVETEAAEPAAEPLPALNDSDSAVRADLQALLPAQSPLRTQEPALISKFTQILATAVEGYLPQRQKLIASPDQPFLVIRDGDNLYLDSDSYQRFSPYVQAFVALDNDSLLAFLNKWQPLFKEAYGQLGLDGDRFDDNLVTIIDLALATPEPAEPIRLKQPKVLYQFADMQLERLPPIQKILIRMGPDNRAKVKAKLGELKAALAAE